MYIGVAESNCKNTDLSYLELLRILPLNFNQRQGTSTHIYIYTYQKILTFQWSFICTYLLCFSSIQAPYLFKETWSRVLLKFCQTSLGEACIGLSRWGFSVKARLTCFRDTLPRRHYSSPSKRFTASKRRINPWLYQYNVFSMIQWMQHTVRPEENFFI